MLNEDKIEKDYPPKWVGPGVEKIPQPEVKVFYVKEKFQKIVEAQQKLEEQRKFLISMLEDILKETEAGNPNVDFQKSKELHLEIRKKLEEIRKKEEEFTKDVLLLAQREQWEDYLLKKSMKRRDFDD